MVQDDVVQPFCFEFNYKPFNNFFIEHLRATASAESLYFSTFIVKLIVGNDFIFEFHWRNLIFIQ